MSERPFLTPDQMRETDFYVRLNVQRDASDEEISWAFVQEQDRYRKFIEKNPTYTKCFYLIEEAYDLLRDPAFRKSLAAVEIDQKIFKVRRKRKYILQWTAAFVICNVVAGFIAYNSPPPGESAVMTGVACGGLGVLIAGGLLKARQFGNALVMFLLALTLVVNVAIFFLNFQKHKLYLDNQNSFDVAIKVDGSPFKTVPAGGLVISEIRVGDHTIESYKMPGDSLLEKFEETIGSQNKYMYNVLSSGKYITGTQAYSEDAFLDYINGVSSPDYPMISVSQRWMLMNYNYIFTKPPNEITVKKDMLDFNKASAERDYIIRAESTDEQYYR